MVVSVKWLAASALAFFLLEAIMWQLRLSGAFADYENVEQETPVSYAERSEEASMPQSDAQVDKEASQWRSRNHPHMYETKGGMPGMEFTPGMEYKCVTHKRGNNCVPIEKNRVYYYLEIIQEQVVPWVMRFAMKDVPRTMLVVSLAVLVLRALGYGVDIRRLDETRVAPTPVRCPRHRTWSSGEMCLDEEDNLHTRQPISIFRKWFFIAITYAAVTVWYMKKSCCSGRGVEHPSPESEHDTSAQEIKREEHDHRDVVDAHPEHDALNRVSTNGETNSETSSQTPNPQGESQSGVPFRRRVAEKARHAFSTPVRAFRKYRSRRRSQKNRGPYEECVSRDDYAFDHPVHSLSSRDSEVSRDPSDPIQAETEGR